MQYDSKTTKELCNYLLLKIDSLNTQIPENYRTKNIEIFYEDGKGFFIETQDRNYYLHKEETRQYLKGVLARTFSRVHEYRESAEIEEVLSSLSYNELALFDRDVLNGRRLDVIKNTKDENRKRILNKIYHRLTDCEG